MPNYTVLHDTWIEGNPRAEGATVILNDEVGKRYVDVGLLEEVETKEGEVAPKVGMPTNVVKEAPAAPAGAEDAPKVADKPEGRVARSTR